MFSLCYDLNLKHIKILWVAQHYKIYKFANCLCMFIIIIILCVYDNICQTNSFGGRDFSFVSCKYIFCSDKTLYNNNNNCHPLFTIHFKIKQVHPDSLTLL